MQRRGARQRTMVGRGTHLRDGAGCEIARAAQGHSVSGQSKPFRFAEVSIGRVRELTGGMAGDGQEVR